MKQPVNDYSNVVRREWTESRVGFKVGTLLANLIGAILLLIALGAGTVAAVDIPRALAVGAFGREAMHDLARTWQMSDWNIFFTAGLGMLTMAAGMLAAVCLIFARRESTWAHISRIPVAAAGFVGAVCSFGTISDFGSNWHRVAEYVEYERAGAAAEYFLRHFWPGAIFGSLLFVAAVFVLAWPARRRAATVFVEPANPVHEQTRQTV